MREESIIMSRMKSIFAVLLLTVIVGIVPQAHATLTVEVALAGSSGAWQALGVGAYNFCKQSGTCYHWTSASNAVNLNDTRVSPVNVDPGTLWVVWNSTGTKVWLDNKVDTIVGNRCYFAQPQCTIVATAANLAGGGSSQISASIWGTDTALPPVIAALLAGGTFVTAAASDVRPEDAAFESCRVNSVLGASTYFGAASDGVDGLGYNANNAPGVCPAAGLPLANYLGIPIKSGYPSSTSQANVLAYNIIGNDPISGTPIPAYTTVPVGADALMFFFERDKGQLTNLKNISSQQAQAAFSGTNCDASAFGLPAGNIGIFLREPLSGTMTATEFTVFRKPTVYTGTGSGAILGMSQELNVGSNNPLAGNAGTCVTGSGARYRGVGAGEIVNWVKNSGATLGTDGIGYQFFSFGNVSKFAGSSVYGYATLNNVDPIFASYGPQSSTGAGYDPGQPAGAGVMPGASNLPAACGGTFPCSEKEIWAGGLSFPHIRDGSYNAWSIIRIISHGTALTNVKSLVKGAQKSVVDDVPDFVPAVKTVGATTTDPGLLVLRSHYQEYDGAHTLIGAAPVNSGTGEAGGDGGGLILPCATAATCSKTTQQVQGNQGLQVRP
jgi:hypothetical protein